jgi:hypothetical protein
MLKDWAAATPKRNWIRLLRWACVIELALAFGSKAVVETPGSGKTT